MNRGTWVFRDGQIIPKHLAGPKYSISRSSFPCPMLIRDHIDPIQGMHDGKMYDSKAALRKSYREGGYIEVGNDIEPLLNQQGTRKAVTKDEVGAAYKKLKEGYRPEPRESVRVPDDLWYDDTSGNNGEGAL